jgi:NAD-dependent DNA ligase
LPTHPWASSELASVLSNRAMSPLWYLRVTTLERLRQFTRKELLALPGIGEAIANEIMAVIYATDPKAGTTDAAAAENVLLAAVRHCKEVMPRGRLEFVLAWHAQLAAIGTHTGDDDHLGAPAPAEA